MRPDRMAHTRRFCSVLLIFTVLFPAFVVRAQRIDGMILDRQTGKPLAFVNVVYREGGKGTVSNIDGQFSISPDAGIEFLEFSCVGYRTLIIGEEEIRPGEAIRVLLEPETYDIEEVKILPGVNPAHRIIGLALENRDRNNPEKMRSFSYTSYNKMVFTLERDSMYVKDEEIDKFLEDSHLFLMEFVSQRDFMHPDRNRETVTASRISGLRDPSFILLASQVQSFSFYEELITIWDRKYLNPVSGGSIRRYLFILEDTMYTERNDTLFVISFRPLKGKNFDGLQGFLHINSNGYAIQNVIAEAAVTEGPLGVRIQQKYDFVDDRQWFPVQLNTDLVIRPGLVRANRQPMTLAGTGRSYLSDIRLDPPLNKKDFSPVVIGVEKDAHTRDEHYWEGYRANPLTRMERNTYLKLDSIGEEANLDRAMKILETVASGNFPVGFLNVDYQSLIHWNPYEGFRLGAAVETNDKISHWVQIGGKLAYGTRDRSMKYGGHLKLNLNRRKDAFMKISYRYDVGETAGWSFIDKPPLTSSEVFRSFLIAGKDRIEEKSLELQFPLLRYLKLKACLSQHVRQMTTEYLYTVSTAEGDQQVGRFHVTEGSLLLKYAHKEKFMETPRGNRISLGTHYPVIYVNLHLGFPVLGGEYEYTKLEGKITKTLITKSLGDTKLSLAGGWADRGLPYPLLYSGRGSYGVFTVESENSFATMRVNEFVSDRFASIHFQQDFGKLLFSRETFQPGIALAASAGFGELKYDGKHVNLDQKTLEKGYYESGILFNNLLRQGFIGYGLGVFYRFGPYALPETIDNFAFKFTVRFNI